MNNKSDPFITALCQIVEQYGVNVLTNSNRVAALLKDYAPKQGKETKLVVAALREGVGSRLLKVVGQDENAQRQCITSCVQTLSEEMYITEDASRFAVESIAITIGLTTGNYAGPVVPQSQSKVSPSKETDEKALVGLHSPLVNLTELTIDKPITVEKGEIKEFKNCSITFLDSIACEGTVRFDSCSIHYKGITGINLIGRFGSGKVEFTNCQMLGIHCNNQKEFIRQTSGHSNSIVFRNCSIEKCQFLISNPQYKIPLLVEILNSQIIEPTNAHLIYCTECAISDCVLKIGDIDQCWSTAVCIDSDRMNVKNTQIIGTNHRGRYGLCPFRMCTDISLSDCSFESLYWGIFDGLLGGKSKTEVARCMFSNCERVFDNFEYENEAELNIVESTFFNCPKTIRTNFSGSITKCKFENCDTPLLTDPTGNIFYQGEISDCQFINCTGVN